MNAPSSDANEAAAVDVVSELADEVDELSSRHDIAASRENELAVDPRAMNSPEEVTRRTTSLTQRAAELASTARPGDCDRNELLSFLGVGGRAARRQAQDARVDVARRAPRRGARRARAPEGGARGSRRGTTCLLLGCPGATTTAVSVHPVQQVVVGERRRRPDRRRLQPRRSQDGCPCSDTGSRRARRGTLRAVSAHSHRRRRSSAAVACRPRRGPRRANGTVTSRTAASISTQVRFDGSPRSASTS